MRLNRRWRGPLLVYSEISIELYEARRAKGLALEHDKLAEALQIYREWPSDKSE